MKPKPNSRHVVGMITVSTNGRSTPLNEGGSCRSLMMPDGRQHHAGAQVERGLDEEVQIGLLEGHFARLLAAFHERVLHFQFAPELDAVREAVAEQQDEPVEVGPERLPGILVEMEIHVARYRQPRLGLRRGLIVAGDGDRLQCRAGGLDRRALLRRLRLRLPAALPRAPPPSSSRAVPGGWRDPARCFHGRMQGSMSRIFCSSSAMRRSRSGRAPVLAHERDRESRPGGSAAKIDASP